MSDLTYFRNYLNDLGHVVILPKLTSCCPLLSGLINTAYSLQLVAIGSETPLVYTISGGSLPTGLSMSSGGLITGTPTVSQTASFTIRVTDVNGTYAETSCSLQILSNLVTSFSDSLQVADANNPNGGKLDGSKWFLGNTIQSNTNSPTACPTYSIGNSTKDSAGALLWSLFGAQNSQSACSAWLLPISTFQTCYGQTQFAQCTLVKSSGSAGHGSQYPGLLVMADPANVVFFGYLFRVSTDDGSWSLQRFGINPANFFLSQTPAIPDGSILRFSADLSVNGQVTLTVTKNGTQLVQYVDNSSSRLLIGSPGLGQTGGIQGDNSPPPISDWRTFSCGLGL